MELPLFPLKNVVLFPGMMLPLHIFEPRYREMINRRVDEKLSFGVLLIDEGHEVGQGATPHKVGTAARITRVERLEGGRMNVATVGTERFRVQQLNYQRSYLTGEVEPYPVTNGSTRRAEEIAELVRPRVAEYMELVAKANNLSPKPIRLPEDPTLLAFLIGMAMQVPCKKKQEILALPGIPEMLACEHALLGREILLTRYMVETQAEVAAMTMGPTGYIFPN